MMSLNLILWQKGIREIAAKFIIKSSGKFVLKFTVKSAMKSVMKSIMKSIVKSIIKSAMISMQGPLPHNFTVIVEIHQYAVMST